MRLSKPVFVLLFSISSNWIAIAEPFKELDFWVGVWDLKWTTPNGEASGKNVISRKLSGKVIHESFTTSGKTPFQGESHSVYDAKQECWKQTWVDNQGNYLMFSGGRVGTDFILSGTEKTLNQAGKSVMNRMVFKDIQENSLTWSWESSDDSGNTWQANWVIFYHRKVQ